MRKPDFCLCENKGASNCEADQRLCFRYSDSTVPLVLKSKIFKLLALFCDYVQVGLCRTWSETTLLVFPRGGSFFFFSSPLQYESVPLLAVSYCAQS